jgi:hypothetical protein
MMRCFICMSEKRYLFVCLDIRDIGRTIVDFLR